MVACLVFANVAVAPVVVVTDVRNILLVGVGGQVLTVVGHHALLVQIGVNKGRGAVPVVYSPGTSIDVCRRGSLHGRGRY